MDPSQTSAKPIHNTGVSYLLTSKQLFNLSNAVVQGSALKLLQALRTAALSLSVIQQQCTLAAVTTITF